MNPNIYIRRFNNDWLDRFFMRCPAVLGDMGGFREEKRHHAVESCVAAFRNPDGIAVGPVKLGAAGR